VQRLFVQNRRDAQPRFLNEESLDRVAGSGNFCGLEIGGARQPSDLPDSVAGVFSRASGVEQGTLEHVGRPDRDDLRQLLRASHAGQ
jgi:hypothetical protein